MDPYLEDPAFWPDFHARFVNYWCEEVAAHLPDHYEARLDEQVNLVQIPAEKCRAWAVPRMRRDGAQCQRSGCRSREIADRGPG
jgi:hypothetical protein